MARIAFRLVISALILISPTALVAAQAATAAPRTFTLSGRVLNSSGKNPVYIALWNQDSFLKTPTHGIRINPGADAIFSFEVPAGRWAISAYEDKNGNGQLDMGLFGPKEPSGFWPAFNGWHKPRFEEVSFSVNADIPHADITLK
jgi:uncharacterized protein (DUF2141 family)